MGVSYERGTPVVRVFVETSRGMVKEYTGGWDGDGYMQGGFNKFAWDEMRAPGHIIRKAHFAYRGTPLIRKRSPPYDPHKARGMSLLKGPRRLLFRISEVPL